MGLEPGFGGQQQLGTPLPPQYLLEQVGPLQQQPALLQPAAGMVQTPERLDE